MAVSTSYNMALFPFRHLAGVQRLFPHRRKVPLLLVVAAVFLLQPRLTAAHAQTDFEHEDLSTLLEEESLFSMKKQRNVSLKKTRDFQTFEKGSDVVRFTSLDRKYISEVDLLSEDALNSDLLPSEYNLEHERHKREVYESSGSENECEYCKGPFHVCTDLTTGYNCTCEVGFVREDQECYADLYKRRD
ncbi:uncharacterized protein LOC125372303 [Haliotis rufescens]|uniref:uncharacterized protein LOC125372303 n=1 Tax=Haliotis rufescens TaxID=6454 RepID=UPI00201F4DFC|nr:uncharacterized protein LOC125372303 [Haliotis rufescens]